MAPQAAGTLPVKHDGLQGAITTGTGKDTTTTTAAGTTAPVFTKSLQRANAGNDENGMTGVTGGTTTRAATTAASKTSGWRMAATAGTTTAAGATS